MFYPGQTILKEGTIDNKMYVIVDGTCNLVCIKTKDKFQQLEFEEDPTRAIRHTESIQGKNPHTKYNFRGINRRGSVPLEDQFGTLNNNGYVSKTLKSVTIGSKSRLEWIGEDLLHLNPEFKFEHSVIAHTKLTTYFINQKDFSKIPYHIRN